MLLVLVAVLTARIQANEDAPPTFFPLQSRWITELGEAPAATPAHDDAQVFVPLRNGTLVAVQVIDGSIGWTTELATEFPPVVADELVESRIGMLLDFESGSMTVFRNDERLGVMATGLSGEYSWAVALYGQGAGARIEDAEAPVSPSAEDVAQAVAYEAEQLAAGDDNY